MSAPPLTDAIALRRQLTRCRTRAAAVLFGQSLLLVGGLSMLAAEVALLARLGNMSLADVAGIAIAAGLLIAIVATRILMPSVRATASLLDARLHLQDRIVTAVQYQAAGDVFSRLVVRDAVDRLSAASPREAFPFRIPRMAAGIPILVTIPIAALAILTTGMPGWRATGTPGPSMTEGVASSATGPATGVSSATRSATSPISAASPPGAPRPAAGGSAPGERGAAAHPITSDQRRDDGMPASASRSEASGSGRPTRGAAGRAGGNESASPGSGASSSSREGRAGGAKEGDLLVDRPIAPRAVSFDDSYRASYRARRAEAEAAIARERIPPERRVSVRQYFAAIRPQDLR